MLTVKNQRRGKNSPYAFISIHPINKKESKSLHLMIITLNGSRLYIQFDAAKEKMISYKWRIAAINSMPYE